MFSHTVFKQIKLNSRFIKMFEPKSKINLISGQADSFDGFCFKERGIRKSITKNALYNLIFGIDFFFQVTKLKKAIKV